MTLPAANGEPVPGESDLRGAPDRGASGSASGAQALPSPVEAEGSEDERGHDPDEGEAHLPPPELARTGLRRVVDRLVVPSLDPGSYYLEVEGNATNVTMSWERPPEPPDGDGDGTPDFYDADVGGTATERDSPLGPAVGLVALAVATAAAEARRRHG